MKEFLRKWLVFYAALAGIWLYYMTIVHGNVTGDIGMLDRIPFTVEYDLQTRSYDYTDSLLMCELVDIDSVAEYSLLLIGDSYTEPKVGLSTCISRTMGDTVRVVCDAITDFFPMRVMLYGLNNHCFRRGQTIILESVERYIVQRFENLDFSNHTRPEGLLERTLWKQVQDAELHKLAQCRLSGEINEPFNYQHFLRWLRVKLWTNTSVKHSKLNRAMFCHKKYADDLFYYKQDYNSCNVTQQQLDTIASRLNRLFAMAELQGINMYFVIIPDKYDLYYPYIINPKRPRPNIQSFLKSIEPRYMERIINTRDSLALYLEKGELDVIRCNDSHWSVATSETMGQAIGQHIMTHTKR